MSLDAQGWVVTDGKGRFLARGGVEGEAWVEDAAQALVFRELWAAQAHPGIALPWTTAMQVGTCRLGRSPSDADPPRQGSAA